MFTSTGGALYGDEAPRPTGEDRIPAPLSPYGSSKWAAEAYVKTWTLSHGIPNATMRLGNVYGPRQSPHGEAGVVAIFTNHLYTDKVPKLYGHGQADAGLCIRGRRGRRPAAGQGNGGHLQRGHGRGNRRGDDLEGALPGGRQVDRAPARGPAAGELQHSCLDASRAERELGWTARTSISEGLALDVQGADRGIRARGVGLDGRASGRPRGCRDARAADGIHVGAARTLKPAAALALVTAAAGISSVSTPQAEAISRPARGGSPPNPRLPPRPRPVPSSPRTARRAPIPC